MLAIHQVTGTHCNGEQKVLLIDWSLRTIVCGRPESMGLSTIYSAKERAALPKDILAVIPRPHLHLDFPGKFTNGQDGALSF
jgi:hypothetical protein